MARLGVLKPLRGTESSLANIVLEDGEVAFAYPSTGPGTGAGGIKMGDGVNIFSNLDWYMWSYDTGNDEAALLHNLAHPEQEILGKIYYLQSYMNNGTQYSTGSTITSGVPYRVIGVNHDDTNNTVDLISLVATNYIPFNSTYTSWENGQYDRSDIYWWLTDTCTQGYSSNIQAKMIHMKERWRQALGNATGRIQGRSSKCKLLNPVELFGYSSATIPYDWQYSSTSDYHTDFASPTGDKYGTLYPVWTDSITALDNRRVFHDKAMSTTIYSWINSWLAFHSSYNYAFCFNVHTDGSHNCHRLENFLAVAPVIRLSNTPGWQYDTGTTETALLNNLKHPEYENIGKVYYIQSFSSSQIKQNIPYIVIDVNHDGSNGTIDLQALNPTFYTAWNPGKTGWSYGKYTTSNFYNLIGSTNQTGYSSAIQAKMCNMTERWREATGESTGTLQTRQTKCKLPNPYELFGNDIINWEDTFGKVSDFVTQDYGQHYSYFTNSCNGDSKRTRESTSGSILYWTTNSYYAGNTDDAWSVLVSSLGGPTRAFRGLEFSSGTFPIIRLSDNPS